jgi:hypothetical protein
VSIVGYHRTKIFDVRKFVCITCFLFFTFSLSCSTKPKSSKQKAGVEVLVFSDFEGPSEASGDCGGYAFWLEEENGRIVGGDFSIFEGGCKITKTKLQLLESPSKENYNLVFTTIVKETPSTEVTMKFEGSRVGENIDGSLTDFDPVQNKFVQKRKVFLKQRDHTLFIRNLPGNEDRHSID